MLPDKDSDLKLVDHSMDLYVDPETRERFLVVFGGFDGSRFCNEVHVLNLDGDKQWVLKEPTDEGIPEPRVKHKSVVIGNHLVIVGGDQSRNHFNDIWTFDLGMLI